MSEFARSELPPLRVSQLRPEAPNLAHLLAAARRGTPEAIDALLKRAEEGQLLSVAPEGREYLLCGCGDLVFTVPLAQLREVLPTLPEVVPLPFSTPWLFGIFALRTDMLGLVDPLPALTGHLSPGSAGTPGKASTATTQRDATPTSPAVRFTTALIVGEGERSIALAMSSIGEIILARDEEIVSEVDTQPQPGTSIDARYISGAYQPPDSTITCPILAVDRLLSDILARLEEEERLHG